MKISRNKLKSIINLIVVMTVALVGYINVKHPLSYFFGVPACTWISYLLSDAICTDLIFGEK
tara:strand:- start:298 stop:483 length:186 start_codon:yes stop_codon:yes gene_type:complete